MIYCGVHVYKYNKNEEILPTIRFDNIVGIILSGKAQILNIEYNGNEIVIENLTPESVFGSNISATNAEKHQIIAKENTEVMIVDYNKILNSKNLKYSYFNIFLKNLFDITSQKCKEKNERIQVLENKQIRDKLLEYFEICSKKSNFNYTNSFYLPFSFKDLADYLAVNRSSMFRELKSLKDEKLISVIGKKITLLYK